MSTRVPNSARPSARQVQRAAEKERRQRHQLIDFLGALVQALGGEVTLTFDQIEQMGRRTPVRTVIDAEARTVRFVLEGAPYAPSVRQRVASRLIRR